MSRCAATTSANSDGGESSCSVRHSSVSVCLHVSESCSWTKEVVDALHEWERLTSFPRGRVILNLKGNLSNGHKPELSRATPVRLNRITRTGPRALVWIRRIPCVETIPGDPVRQETEILKIGRVATDLSSGPALDEYWRGSTLKDACSTVQLGPRSENIDNRKLICDEVVCE